MAASDESPSYQMLRTELDTTTSLQDHGMQ